MLFTVESYMTYLVRQIQNEVHIKHRHTRCISSQYYVFFTVRSYMTYLVKQIHVDLSGLAHAGGQQHISLHHGRLTFLHTVYCRGLTTRSARHHLFWPTRVTYGNQKQYPLLISPSKIFSPLSVWHIFIRIANFKQTYIHFHTGTTIACFLKRINDHIYAQIG